MLDKTLQQAIRKKDFVLTAQLQLQEDTGRQGVIRQAQQLSAVVDAVTVPANPFGAVHMAGLAAASLLIANDIDPVLHLASRDRNRIGLRSDLLGAVAIGVTSLILQRGDKLSHKRRRKAAENTKVGSLNLLRAATGLSTFQSEHGEPELLLGTLANVMKTAPDWQPEMLIKKVDAGARFLQTRACLDVDKLRHYMAALVAAQLTHRCHIAITVPVLHSAKAASSLNESMKSEAIPERIVKQLETASAPEQLGIDIAADFLRELRNVPGVSGANLVPYGDVESVAAVIDAASPGI